MLVATALVGSACHGLLRHAAFHASRRSKFGALLTPRFFKVSRPPSIYGSSPRCVHAPRGGHASAPPAALVADAPHHPTVGTHARRAPRTTHRAHAPRTTLIAAHCTAHRAAPRTTRQAAPRCATHHPCALAIVGPGPPGAAAHKRTPGAHPFSRAVFVGARACRPFCTAHRAAPRTTRHAAPRRATLRHARCRCHNPRWRLSERPGQAPRVSLGIR